MEKKMLLEDWLDDLCVRFIINLPQEDLSSVARICFQVEEAQWFYEDFIRPLDPTLPSLSLRSFCLRIFQHCPLLSQFSNDNHMRAFEEFLAYKTRVPVRGAIMLNDAMDSVVLVKGWKKGANWSFPRGKINKDEDDLDCAVREVYEETGFDIRSAGLVPVKEEVKYIEVTMREQHMRLYVFRNVPMNTSFLPRTRKEISKIEWYRLSDLPAFKKKAQPHIQDGSQAAVNANKFYMVAPFLVPLKKWVLQQQKKDLQRGASTQLQVPPIAEDTMTEEEAGTVRNVNTTISEPQSKLFHSRGLDTMAGATAELHRLLQIQPPTQGLQPASAVQSPTTANSGSQLLAFLQGGQTRKPRENFLPQMPDGNLPTDMPTVISVPQYAHQYNSSRLQNQPASNMFIPPLPQQQPNHLNLHGLRQQAHQPPAIPVERNNQPVLYPTPIEQNYGYQPPQTQELQHPQPLPPQVQKALFNTSLPHRPDFPPPLDHTSQIRPSPQTLTTFQSSASQKEHGPVSLPSTNFETSSHVAGLLSQFNGLGTRDPVSVVAPVPGPESLGRNNNFGNPLPTQAGHIIAHHRSSQSYASDMGSGTSQKRPLPTILDDAHRSSLLNIFKAASDDRSGVKPTPNPAERLSSTQKSAQNDATSNGLTSTQDSSIARNIRAPTQNFRSQMHDSLAPSFTTRVQPASASVPSAESPLPNKSIRAEFRNHETGPSQPQTSNWQQSLQDKASLLPVELAAPTPPAANGYMMPPTSIRPKKNALTEHNQNLLALFGKTSSVEARGASISVESPSVAVLSRSRLGSLVTTPEESESRTHTPSSPAVTAFLREYLDEYAKKSEK